MFCCPKDIGITGKEGHKSIYKRKSIGIYTSCLQADREFVLKVLVRSMHRVMYTCGVYVFCVYTVPHTIWRTYGLACGSVCVIFFTPLMLVILTMFKEITNTRLTKKVSLCADEDVTVSNNANDDVSKK